MADPENTFKNHWKSIKKLSGTKRYEFIWEYFKFHIIAVVLAIAAIAWGLNHYLINPPAKTYLSVSFYGGFVHDEVLKRVEDGLSGILPDELADEFMISAVNYDITSGDYTVMQAQSQRFAANLMIKEIDLIIMDGSFLDDFIEQGVVAELDTFGHSIKLEGNKFLSECGFQTDGKILVVASNSKRADKADEAIKIILGE